MENYELHPQRWKQLSILTNDKKDGHRLITGYSETPFNQGDTIHLSKTKRLEIIQETERRDAAGNWPNGDNKNRWFRASAKFFDIENPNAN